MAERKKPVVIVKYPVQISVLWGNILFMSVSGAIDSKRAQDLMESVLSKIEETRSKTFILDIGGVEAVDTAVANHLTKISKATRLMGCVSIFSGISPHIAQTIVQLGISLEDIITESTLRDSLERAFKMIGLEVRAIEDGKAERPL